jgi:HD-like signal output (HDOD) protein/ActR/RegA family two-component response regulator
MSDERTIESRILFVDDEVAILDGLRDLLRKERRRWDMVFAVGGAEALEELQRQRFDVVVSDIRMPGLDGAALLTRVKAEYPHTARIVLTGHADRDAVLRVLPVAHQFLVKPCDANALRVAIERTQALHALLASPDIRAVVGSLVSLPSVPQTYLALTEAAQDPRKGIGDMAEIIRRDPSMSSKVLQVVNSAYFGTRQGVASIQQAVMFMGIELLKGLALTTNVFKQQGKALGGLSLEELQQRSLRTACLARRFVEDPKRSDEVFTAALMLDVGQIVIALGLPQQYADIRAEADAGRRSMHEVELARLGVSHAEVGAYLLGVWGLPFSILECVAYHHRPSAVGDGPCETLAALHVADALVDAPVPGAPEPDIDLAFLDRAGVGDRLAAWRTIADRTRGQAA